MTPVHTRTLAALATLVAMLLLAVAAAPVEGAFYVPGIAPVYHKKDEVVSFQVGTLRSSSVLFPTRYYDLPFCQPAEIKNEKQSLGELIWGDRTSSSLYAVKMLENSACTILPGCDHTKNNKEIVKDIKKLERFIEEGYYADLSMDNLPLFTNTSVLDVACKDKLKPDQLFTAVRGYLLGIPKVCQANKKTLIHNFLDITIKYNTRKDVAEGAEPEYMVVGLVVTPRSVEFKAEDECNSEFKLQEHTTPLSTEGVTRAGENKQLVYWAYSVTWEKSEVEWATRWDEYFRSSLAGSSPGTHWFYVTMGFLVVLLTVLAVSVVLMRALHRDFNRYNVNDPEDLQEETGWKLIHADVFRRPYHSPLLSIMVGTGAQIVCMVTGVVFIALLGFLSPSRRGSLLTAIIALSVLTSFVGGYVCGRFLQYFNRREWRYVFACGCGAPGAVWAVFMLTTFIGIAHGAVTPPLMAILTLLILFLMVSLPLMVIGASFAFRQEPMEDPVRVGKLAREIPEQTGLNSKWFLYSVPPVFPLLTLAVELHFLLQGLWANQVYYVFGFLALGGIMWFIVSALVTIFHLYYVLCYENHQWWWIALLLPGCLGLHFFLFSTYFFITQLSIRTFASTLIYFLYMGLISVGYGLAAGAVGFMAGLWFVRTIYANIKID